jgi:stage II sporulation protein D
MLALALLLAVGAAGAAEPGAFTSIFVARWNLNHGEYLVDVGQYLEALEAFDTAVEMADVPEVRSEAQLQKASVLAVFLDAPDEALRVYDDLLARYPGTSAAEVGLFRAAMTLFDAGQYARAAQYFDRYLQQYPQGASRDSAEFLLRQSRSQAAAPPPPTAPSTAPVPTRAPAPPLGSTPVPSPAVRPTLVACPTAAARTTPTAIVPPASAPAPPGAPIASIAEVRVRVFKGHRDVRIESDGAVAVTPPVASGTAIDLVAHDGLVGTGAQPGTREVTIRADHALALRAARDTRHYRGSVSVRADGNTLVIINHVGLEEYLYGVVTKESVPSWPLEALKAQAVASRTYALYQVEHRRDRAYDMVDDEGSQVYGGVEGESAPGRRAVDETRGMVLAYGDRPIYAMFTANTGWYTGDPKFIFDQALPYLNAVPDPYSPGEQLGHWTRTYGADELRRALAEIGVRLGPIHAIKPQLTCPSGRIVRVAIEDDQGAHTMRTRPTLGRALKLPEILLDVRHEGDRFVFAGGGFGHGVGLSQWGAKNMAAKGFAVKDILAFYYRGAQLTVLRP